MSAYFKNTYLVRSSSSNQNRLSFAAWSFHKKNPTGPKSRPRSGPTESCTWLTALPSSNPQWPMSSSPCQAWLISRSIDCFLPFWTKGNLISSSARINLLHLRSFSWDESGAFHFFVLPFFFSPPRAQRLLPAINHPFSLPLWRSSQGRNGEVKAWQRQSTWAFN